MPVLSCHDNNLCCYNMKPGGVGHLLSSSAKKGARSRKRHGYVMPIKTRLKVSRSNKDKPKSDLHKLHLSDNHRENRDYMYKIQSTGEIIVETTTIPRIAKKFNITNA